MIDTLRSLKAWMGVIDGGGNRTEMDRKLYGIADLVLLPFRDSHEDIRTVIRDLEMFPHAHAIPTQWPTNVWQRETADQTLTELLAPYRERILQPVAAISASKLLLQKDLPSALPSPLGNACRSVARQVLDLLRVALPDEAAESTLASARPTTHGHRSAHP